MKKANYKKIFSVILTMLSLIIVQSAWSDEHTAEQTRPIQLGTSGGNVNDSSRAFCCGGTLGALVQDANKKYILSNNHVLAKTNQGISGDDIIQPGLIDQNPVCSKDYSNGVADLTSFVSISFMKGTTNTVDAAIAEVRSNCIGSLGYTVNCVDPLGSILDIGQVSNSTVTTPTFNMPVKKSGRTTGQTTGTITATNVTVDIRYNKQCGIGSQKARFINQIMIGPAGFSAGGDSGSLIVENCSQYPRVVGLLFAGSSTSTLANPISDVLSLLGVSMVGSSLTPCSSSTSTGVSLMTAQSQLPPQANHRAVEAVSKVKERHEEAILRIEGVVGIGIGLSDTEPGQVVIEVYTKRPVHEMKHLIPEALEGIPVKIVETGEIVAY